MSRNVARLGGRAQKSWYVDGELVRPGISLANAGMVALGAGQFQGGVGIYVDGAADASTNILIDITGYYS